jgi:hypothetical protein
MLSNSAMLDTAEEEWPSDSELFEDRDSDSSISTLVSLSEAKLEIGDRDGDS